MLIRQAHPGPGAQPYRDFEQKKLDAERWKQEDGIRYTVAVDDVQGTTHQVYGNLADPTYLIDSDGRVAFYNMWTHAPTLNNAIEELLQSEQQERTSHVVRGGIHRSPHLAAAMTDGWRGIRRGLPQSFIELETSFPSSAVGPWIGHHLRPVLEPITLRATPLPPVAKVLLGVGLLALFVAGTRAVSQRRGAAEAFASPGDW